MLRPPLALLFALIVRLSYEMLYPDPVPENTDLAVAMFGSLALGSVLLYELVTLLRALWSRTRGGASRLRRLYRAGYRVQGLLPPLAYAVLVFGGHWPVLVQYELSTGSVFLQELLLIGPFGIFFFLSGLGEIRLTDALTVTAMRWRSILFVAGIYLGLYAWIDLLQLHPWTRAAFEELTVGHVGLLALGLFFAVLLAPLWMSFCYGLHPLRAPELRQSLAEVAGRLKVRTGSLKVYDTRGRMLNAFVVGPFGWTRLVVFTDEMLRRFGESQLVAVFAHELAHIRAGHFWRSLLFVAVLPVAAYVALSPFAEGETERILILSGLACLALPVLRWQRVRFEHEADLMGASALPEPSMAIDALEEVLGLQAGTAGIKRRGAGFFHPPVEERIELLRMSIDGAEGARAWLRRGARIQALLFLLTGIAVTAVGLRVADEWPQERASFLLASGQLDEAAELWAAQGLEPEPYRAEPGELVMRLDDNGEAQLQPFEFEQAGPSTWQLLGERITRARVLLHAGDQQGPSLVPELHRRALRRAAQSLRDGDREAGRRWLSLAGHFEVLEQSERALLLWLEAWRKQDENAQHRAERILKHREPAPSFGPFIREVLG
jgi:Zn-dependent protease with chaperone function